MSADFATLSGWTQESLDQENASTFSVLGSHEPQLATESPPESLDQENASTFSRPESLDQEIAPTFSVLKSHEPQLATESPPAVTGNLDVQMEHPFTFEKVSTYPLE